LLSVVFKMADVCVPLFIILCTFALSLASEDEFHEELLVKPLPTGQVYTYFQFTTIWDIDIKDRKAFSHFNLFPKSFGQIVDKYSVEELHLSLTQGHWKSDLWGYPVVSAPPGAELWVWFQDRVKESVDEHWSGLTQALSGQFCASLNFIDTKTSVSPTLSFKREGVASSGALNSSLLRYSALGREIVCTENLTPWKKLLPCDSKAGIATLFNALVMYSVNYHSMAIHLRPLCKDPACQVLSLELKQTLSIVFDPLLRSDKQDWSFRKLFSRTIQSQCPLASTSRVFVDITSNKTGSKFTLNPPSLNTVKREVSGHADQVYSVYEVKDLVSPASAEGNIVFKQKEKNRQVHPPQLYAHRFITGYGEKKGGVNCLIHNNHPTEPLPIVYFATFPWFVRIFLHTLKIESSGKLIKPDKLHVIPAKDRERPYILELLFTLPANSITKMSLQFERGFLKWTEHPPDAHHGFYISSSVISARLSTTTNVTAGSLTSSLLFPRRFEDVDPTEANITLLGRLKAKLGKIKEKIFGSKESVVSEEKKKS
ncbi:hypothetical protein QZH41_018969, partial [Actinostola sp. cb2023]